MNGQLYNLLRIASYSNYHLIGTAYEFPDEKYIRSIEFKDTEGIKCHNLIEWQSELKMNSCHKVYVKLIVRSGDRAKAGLSNKDKGEFLICDYGHYFEVWSNSFELIEGKWHVTYQLVKTIQEDFEPEDTSYLDILNECIQSYKFISEFACEIDEKHWCNFFNKGYGKLMAFRQKRSYAIYDLVEKIQWPFGAMGSWNDSPPYAASEQGRSDDYNQYSDRLYSDIYALLEYTMNGNKQLQRD